MSICVPPIINMVITALITCSSGYHLGGGGGVPSVSLAGGSYDASVAKIA